MNATEALKNKDGFDVRLRCGNAWMYWDETNEEWFVLTRPRAGKNNRILYRGKSESDAIKALLVS